MLLLQFLFRHILHTRRPTIRRANASNISGSGGTMKSFVSFVATLFAIMLCLLLIGTMINMRLSIIANHDTSWLADLVSVKEQSQTNHYYNSSVTKELPSTSRRLYHAFWCGHNGFADIMAECLFNDAQSIQRFTENHLGNNHSQHDVMVASFEGRCFAHTPRGTNIPTLFQGRVLYVSGEPADNMYPLDVRDHIYSLTHNADDGKRNIRSYFGTMYTSCGLPPATSSSIFSTLTNNNVTLKVQNTGERFLIYTHSRCVPYREEAFASLSQIGRGPAYRGGRCKGSNMSVMVSINKTLTSTTTNNSKILLDEEIRSKTSKGWRQNHLLFNRYRFALVMENTKQDGYITEKIVNAFLAGCVPIYYGSLEIFDIFNPNAFIYYDIEHPQVALERVAYLEKNETAYLDVLRNEPILKNGNQTIRDFFSYSDDLGHGHLKRRIRQMMGML